MRKLACGLALLGVLPFLGCAALYPHIDTNANGKRPVPEAVPTAEQLLAYQRKNAELVKSMQVRDLDLECKQGKIGASLGATLHCQKPRDFRLLAKSAISDEVDLGSNGEEFWFWVKRGDPQQRVFHCSYEDFDKGEVRLPFPFRPDYVLEALGMAVTGTPETCQVVPHEKSCELIEEAVVQGRTVRKITVFNRSPVSAEEMRSQGKPQVVAHILQDATTKEMIATATIEKVQLIDVGGVSAVVPRKVRLEYPKEQVTLSMTLGRVTLNQGFTQEQQTNLFTRAKLSGYASFDLARGAATPAGNIRRVGGTFPKTGH